MKVDRKLRMGMVGGGPGAFIGEVHRKAAVMDGLIEFVGGAFDADPEQSLRMRDELYVDPDRVYGTFAEMIERETALPESERMDFITICTPNNWHFPIACDALKAGFHVMCEKPMTINVDQARILKELVESTGRIFGLMHNYTGYPMVKLARDIVRGGELGAVRKIVVRYPQGWLATALEQTGNLQASWRVDPEQSGVSGCGGDIGTHAENLAEYISGLKMTHLCAELTSFIEGRRLDDDINCLVKYEQGAKGILHASQISIGEENNLGIWIYGERGALEWHQEHPNYLHVKRPDAPLEVWRRGNDYVSEKSPAAGRATRLPFGHPEAFFEAFANTYVNFADTVRASMEGVEPDPLALDFPGVEDGLRGMLFLETLVESARSNEKWTEIRT
jgi:predicted dehydrogenase